jgi:hypothetical protein
MHRKEGALHRMSVLPTLLEANSFPHTYRQSLRNVNDHHWRQRLFSLGGTAGADRQRCEPVKCYYSSCSRRSSLTRPVEPRST